MSAVCVCAEIQPNASFVLYCAFFAHKDGRHVSAMEVWEWRKQESAQNRQSAIASGKIFIPKRANIGAIKY